MAFQITDDILDYTGTEAVTGKPAGLDLREHKVTLPLIAALEKVTSGGRERIEALFGAEQPDDDLIMDVVGIVTEAGGIEYARQQGERFAHEAEETLQALPPRPARTALAGAISCAP